MRLGDGVHLTYCTNIHAGETWEEIRANLATHLPRVRDRVAPAGKFGIGLRLSASAADTLARPAVLDEFRRFLDEHGFYVFTLNGFPYGRFHGVPVKEAVYRPDWRDAERLRYSDVLADVLAALLPADGDPAGTISTVPCAYGSEIGGPADLDAITDHLLRHAAHLVDLRRRTGRTIALALEPEPCCHLETIEESVAFFTTHLFTPRSAGRLAALTGLDPAQAHDALRTHLGLCLDLCHAAVEFEDVADGLARLAIAGIPVLKVQISAGLRITDFDAPTLAALRAYQDPVYLHQVVARRGADLRRFTDLPEAFASLDAGPPPDEWRVHFHVPVFHDDLGAFRSTRDFIERALALHRQRPLSRHLEVETYTWDVLPPALRATSVDEAIAREMTWVLGVLGA